LPVDSPILELRVSAVQAKCLQMIADRGGEIPWDWDSPHLAGRDDVRQMYADMINKQLIREVEHTTHALLAGKLHIQLTDRGRAAVKQIEIALGRPQIITSPS
jgi:hypothetical protein